MKQVNNSISLWFSKSISLKTVIHIYSKFNLFFVTLCCVLLLVFRASMGVDLSDEAYYASFIDGWIKNGVKQNTNLMFHQTAAILVYPFAILYTKFRGSEDGLILFLRFVYIAISAFSATFLYKFVLIYRGAFVATFTTIFAILFIPFGLPAPSYNTISMFLMTAALSLFAISFRSSYINNSKLFLPRPLWVSAILWTPACLAYPPLLIPLVSLLALAPTLTRSISEGKIIRNYIILCIVVLFIGILALIIILGATHLWNSILFTNSAASVSGGIARKLVSAYDLFINSSRFATLTLLAILISIGRAFKPYCKLNWLGVAAFGILGIGLVTSGKATLYIFSHDLVFLLAITGAGIAFRYFIDRKHNSGIGAIGVIYFVSMLGGVVVSATAYNGIVNFPIGCFLAACISLSTLGPSIEKIKNSGIDGYTVSIKADCHFPLYLSVSFASFCLVGVISLNFYYGQNERISFRNSTLIESGVFEGLRTDSNMALYLQKIADEINGQGKCGNKISVLGNGPSFYLLTPMVPRTLTTFSITVNSNKNFATDAEATFFSAKENRPDVIVVSKAAELSSFDVELLNHYSFVRHVVVGRNSAKIYIRPSCVVDN